MKHFALDERIKANVASSREDAWIETVLSGSPAHKYTVASSREDAWIETLILRLILNRTCRVLPRGRVD